MTTVFCIIAENIKHKNDLSNIMFKKILFPNAWTVTI